MPRDETPSPSRTTFQCLCSQTLPFLAVVQFWCVLMCFCKMCLLSSWTQCGLLSLLLNAFFLSLGKNLRCLNQLLHTMNWISLLPASWCPIFNFFFVLVKTPALQMCSDWQPASLPCASCRYPVCWVFPQPQHVASSIYHNSGLRACDTDWLK